MGDPFPQGFTGSNPVPCTIHSSKRAGLPLRDAVVERGIELLPRAPPPEPAPPPSGREWDDPLPPSLPDEARLPVTAGRSNRHLARVRTRPGQDTVPDHVHACPGRGAPAASSATPPAARHACITTAGGLAEPGPLPPRSPPAGRRARLSPERARGHHPRNATLSTIMSLMCSCSMENTPSSRYVTPDLLR